ncbi:MAG: hypothetical protein HY901_00785 [Deltaproteobacteria bacterium]|nr:hypothetical protein [Deltaproteobacteria bacterium]
MTSIRVTCLLAAWLAPCWASAQYNPVKAPAAEAPVAARAESEMGSRLGKLEQRTRKLEGDLASLSERSAALAKALETAPSGAQQQKVLAEIAELQKSLKAVLARGVADEPAAPQLSAEQEEHKARLQAERDAAATKLAGLEKAVQNGLDPALISGVRDDLAKQLARLDAEIAAIKPEPPAPKPTLEEVSGKVASLELRLAKVAEEAAKPAPALVAAAAPAPTPAAAEKTFIKVRALLQPALSIAQSDAPDGKSSDTDLYLRRARIMLVGQLNERINFFAETDSPNFGKKGDFAVNAYIQDAWLELNLLDELQLDAGMLITPFSRHAMQSGASLHSLEYRTAVVRYPTGSNKVWRDMGVTLRGAALGRRLDYRLAILNGVHGSKDDPRNPTDLPRVTARVAWSFLQPEAGPGLAGFFYKGISLAKTAEGIVTDKKHLTLGVSFDWQKDLNVSYVPGTTEVARRQAYWAAAVDLFADLPVAANGLMGLTGQLNGYYYDHGDRRLVDGAQASYYGANAAKYGSEYTGYGMMSELGVRYDAYSVFAAVDFFEATRADGDAGDVLSTHGGLAWWWAGYSSNLKLQLGRTKKDGGDWKFQAVLQAQLLF